MATASDIKMRIFAEDKTAKAFKSAKSNMTKFASAAKAAKAGLLAIGAAAAGVGVATKKFAAMADDIIKFSKRTAIATDSLQELSFVASQSGVSAETFNKSMVMMVKNFSDARDGSGMAVDELRRLQIQLNDTNGELRPAEDLLNDLADKLAGVSNETERLAIATAIFGTRGSVMLQMLDQGSTGMNALRQRARDLGLVMSEETLKSAEKITDEFDIMARVTQKNLTTALMQLAPTITRVSAALVDGAQSVARFLNMFTSDEALVGLDQINQRIAEHQERINALNRELSDTRPYRDRSLDPMSREEIARLQKQISLLEARRKLLYPPERKDPVPLKQELSEMEKVFQGMDKGISDYRGSIKSLSEETADVTVKGFKSMEDALVEFTMTGKLNFKDMARSIIADLVRIQIRQSMLSMLPTGNIFGSLFGGGGTPAPVEDHSIFKASMAGGGYTGMGARSGGIDGKGGFPAILHPNETVIDHAQGQSGGIVVNQSINISTGVAQTVRTEIASLMPQIAEASKSAVLDARRRGGSFAKGFGG